MSDRSGSGNFTARAVHNPLRRVRGQAWGLGNGLEGIMQSIRLEVNW